jgi:hypothetical protein
VPARPQPARGGQPGDDPCEHGQGRERGQRHRLRAHGRHGRQPRHCRERRDRDLGQRDRRADAHGGAGPEQDRGGEQRDVGQQQGAGEHEHQATGQAGAQRPDDLLHGLDVHRQRHGQHQGGGSEEGQCARQRAAQERLDNRRRP